VKRFLASYLPSPTIDRTDDRYFWKIEQPESIGRLHAFYGNIGVVIRAYAYILSQGPDGLREVSRNAVLNANYLLNRLVEAYDVPYGKLCMHEFVASAVRQKAHGVRALDIAKRILDYGYYAPSIYFPLIVPEALMIEPTETESLQWLDAFADAMLAIAAESASDPRLLQTAPHNTPFSRIDEALAARKLELRWTGTGG
jgi:glycine dehydrogenase subunit 2